MTRVYPKWISDNHRPSGPIANVTGLHFKAGSQELAWHRDPLEMYSFPVTVPDGVKEIQATFVLISADSAGRGGAAAFDPLLARPHLERAPGQVDVLTEILKAKPGSPPKR